MLHRSGSKIGFANRWSKSTIIVAIIINHAFFHILLKNTKARKAGKIK
jgi:hypothetical protein